MNEYPAGMTGAELDGDSLLDNKAPDEIIEEMLSDWADSKTIFSFYLNNVTELSEWFVSENVWDKKLEFSVKHDIACEFIRSESCDKFVEDNIEKYEEWLRE